MTNTETSEQESVSSRLFTQIAEFNQYPVRYIHSSWLKQVQYAQLVVALQEQEQSHYHLSHYLLNCFDLNSEFDYEFQSLEKRIALTSGADLVALALYIGIVLNESIIRAVVRRRERVLLQECLGEQAYLFAVKKAQFFSKHTESAEPGILIDWQHTERFKSFLTVNGLQVLAVAYAGMPRAFKQRLLLKFPKSWQKYLENSGGNLSREQSINLLIKCYKEVDRQWRHLLF